MTPRGLACLVAFAVVAAPAHAAPREKASTEQALPAKGAEWSEADYKALRDQGEARQREWDRKMKALTGSICTGC